MNNFVINMMNSYGYIGIFLLIMIENFVEVMKLNTG